MAQPKKDSTNQVRLFDGDGYRKRADCICFRDSSEDEVSVLKGVGPVGEAYV